jgi:hypothetical protein
MAKVIEVVFRDGSIWHVAAQPIAEARARYYAKADESTTYEAELAYTLSSDYELKDWATNNMNADELVKHATCHKPPIPLDFEEGWNDSENSIYNVEERP